MRIFGKLEYFPANSTIKFSLKSIRIRKTYSKKQTDPNFTEHGVVLSLLTELHISNNDSLATGTKPVVCIRWSNHTFTPFTSDWLLYTWSTGRWTFWYISFRRQRIERMRHLSFGRRLSNTPQSATNRQVGTGWTEKNCTLFSLQ